MPILLILLGLGAAILVSRKGSAATGGGTSPGASDENYVDAKGRTWRIHRDSGPTSAGKIYPPPGAVMMTVPGYALPKSADFITIPAGTSRDVVINIINLQTKAATPTLDAPLPTPPPIPSSGTGTALGLGGESTPVGPYDMITPQGSVGIKPPWAYLYNSAPNGDYDLVWIYFDKFPTEMYVAAKRGSVERGNWYTPPGKLMTKPIVDSVDLRGGVTLEKGATYIGARSTKNSHIAAVTIDPTIGAAMNFQVEGSSPYGTSLGATLPALVSNAYPGIPALGATTPPPFGGLGSAFGFPF